MSPSFSAMSVGAATDGAPMTVTADHFEWAAELFNDRHPIHHDDAYARERGHPARTLPGSMIGGIMSSSLAATLSDFGLALLEYRIHFRAPAYEGDVLNARCVVVDKKPKPHRGGGLVFFDMTLHNQEGVLVADGNAIDLVADGVATDEGESRR